MKTRVLVLGARGQVGFELLRALHAPDTRTPVPTAEAANCPERGWEVVAATRDGSLADGGAGVAIELADPASLGYALDGVAPDVIINAAAYTAVDRAEDEPELAQRINAEAVGVLGEWAARRGARVIHYSTDYVFDGSARQPYREADATHPLGAYGRSKLAGERALQETGARQLILRTAWVYAARGHNFLHSMLRLGRERAELRVVDDQIGAPTSAALIARVTVQVLGQWLRDGDPERDGVFHLVAAGKTSWCGFAMALFQPLHDAGLLDNVPRVEAIRTAEYPTKAVRPAYSVLDTGKLRAAFDVNLPDWHLALADTVGELAQACAARKQL